MQPRSRTRSYSLFALLGVLVSLLTVAPVGTANAAESVPTLQYTAPVVPAMLSNLMVESSDGSVTLPCSMETGYGESDLVSYSSSGSVVRQISRTTQIDGVPNCIQTPVVDKNGDLYGIPWGRPSPGAPTAYGPNLLAYDGSALKWKYPAQCGSATKETPTTIGADGNIYVLVTTSNGVRLQGLAPELESGQTQPAVKTDVQVSSSSSACWAELLPYRDGIVIKPQSGNVKHYSYGGELVSDRSISRHYDGVVNDEGVFFTPKSVGSSPTSVYVTATHPGKGELWSVMASTPGANVQDSTVYSLAGGGAVALVKEQKMYQGIPATPSEYIWTLAVLGSNGQIIQREYLPNAAGAIGLGQPYVLPDSNGKVVVLREITVPTGVSNPSTRPGISIGVYNPATDSWTYQETITGNNSAQGGPYGYRLEFLHYRYPAVITDDTITLVGKCSGNCTSTPRKLYALDVSDISTVYPKGKTLIKTQRPTSSYIALGDSFSSGEGVEPFEAGTTTPGVNTCHRSDLAYPNLISGEGDVPALGTDGFRACSGAVTTNVTDLAQWDEGVQLDWWRDTTTDVVTISIGGNDIGFADFGTACVLGTCAKGSASYNTALNKVNNELPNKLKETYRKILAYAPNAEVYVLGYPQVVANKAPNDPNDPRCIYMHNDTGDTGAEGYPWEDAVGARDIVTKLNQKIDDAITAVQGEGSGNSRLQFVDVNASGSPFAGHEVCGTDATSWFQNVDQVTGDPAYVFHPNSLGQEGYATIIGAEINN